MAQCEWTDAHRERCRHDAEDGETLCMFHLPACDGAKPADKFWRSFAHYYMAQLSRNADLQKNVIGLWAFQQRDEELIKTYSDRCLWNGRLDYRGFVFPAMDAQHNLRGFAFAAADFTCAQFASQPDRAAVRDGRSLQARRPRLGGSEPDMSEPPDVQPEELAREDTGADADFSGSQFVGNAIFRDAKFQGTSDFSATEFAFGVVFANASFAGKADFSGAVLHGDSDLRIKQFEGASSFSNAVFDGRADFGQTKFGGKVCFANARFLSEVAFADAGFEADTDFTRTRLEGPSDFSNVSIATQLRFLKCTLHDCLLFENPNIKGTAALLFWGIRFAHGRSRIKVDQDRTSGSLVESSGEILLRDVTEGMDRVSFLRTDIYSDRIHVRFSNVVWNKCRRSQKFLLDASYLSPINEWISIGLGARDTELAELFNRNAGSVELEAAVQEDADRIVRDIRRSYEEDTGYSDAGDYHAIEMDFRRRRRKTSRFYKVGLWLYWLFSNYGESPSRAWWWLLGTWGTAAIIYMFTGFCFPVHPVRYLPALDLANFSTFIGDFFLRAVPFAFVNLFASYFRNIAQTSAEPHATHGLTVGISVIETTLGIVSLTLFLLAVRRRFRR
jgi:uncharacterized protein YjbI with pentapeptide repeats